MTHLTESDKENLKYCKQALVITMFHLKMRIAQPGREDHIEILKMKYTSYKNALKYLNDKYPFLLLKGK